MIQESTIDFFENRLKGTSNWTLHRITRAFDGEQTNSSRYSFYSHIGQEVRSEASVIEEDSKLVCPEEYVERIYTRHELSEPKPTEETIVSILNKEAETTIKHSLFGNVEKKRSLFVIEHTAERMRQAEEEWLKRIADFKEAENQKEAEFVKLEKDKKEANALLRKQFELKKSENRVFLYSTKEEIEQALSRLDTFFPQDINLYYQVDMPHGLVNLSFEAPQERLFSSVRSMARQDANKKYLDCVCGMAYVLAYQCFCVSAKVKEVFISAFSNKFNPISVTLEELTLYSVDFDRDTFNWAIKPKSFLPYESFVFFPHSINVQPSFEFSSVNPIDLIPASPRPFGDNMFADGAPNSRPQNATMQKPAEISRKETVIDDFSRTLEYNPQLELPDFVMPSADIWTGTTAILQGIPFNIVEENCARLAKCLESFKIKAQNIQGISGPLYTLYQVTPEYGVRFTAFQKVQDDIAMALRTRNAHISQYEEFVGILVVNPEPKNLSINQILSSDEYKNNAAVLPIALGCAPGNNVKIIDLEKAPHLLISGSTRQGKTTLLKNAIASLSCAKHPAELKFVIIDPTKLEFSPYASLNGHYIAEPCTSTEDTPIINDPQLARDTIVGLKKEMEYRLKLISGAEVNEIKKYNAKFKLRLLNPAEGHRYMPYIVVILDDFNMLMDSCFATNDRSIANDINDSLQRLAEKGVTVGIHLIISTIRSKTEDMLPAIKEHFNYRVSFKVGNRYDSINAIGYSGAETLCGPGDMLFCDGDDVMRIQCADQNFSEAKTFCQFIENQHGYKKSYNAPYYLPDPEDSSCDDSKTDMFEFDDRFEEAARLVVACQRGSTSDIQRRLGLGYFRAGRVMEQLEAAGIVGPQEGSKPRQVLVSSLDELDIILKAFLR